MELDYLKIKATIESLERDAFGPLPESQIRQIRAHAPSSSIPLTDVLKVEDETRPLLQWLSWEATFEDAKKSFIAFYTGCAWATSGDPSLPECIEALRILREEPSAKRLILHVLNQSKSKG